MHMQCMQRLMMTKLAFRNAYAPTVDVLRGALESARNSVRLLRQRGQTAMRMSGHVATAAASDSAHAGQHAFHTSHHFHHAAAFEFFHHRLHLLELRQHAVDFLHLNAGAGCDTAFA